MSGPCPLCGEVEVLSNCATECPERQEASLPTPVIEEGLELWSVQFSNIPPAIMIWSAKPGYAPRNNSIALCQFETVIDRNKQAKHFREIVAKHNAAIEATRGSNADYCQGEPPTCEGCGKAVLRGQFVHCYEDAGEVHVRCDEPNARTDPSEVDKDAGPVFVLLGTPLMRFQIKRPASNVS